MENQYNNLNHKLDRLQKEKQTRKKTDTHHQCTQFYTRTVNLTNIRFSQEEIALLNNGLQHSIEKPLKKTLIHDAGNHEFKKFIEIYPLFYGIKTSFLHSPLAIALS